MKIVIVSGFITPRISPRSFRATELAKAFAGMGHDVTLMASLGKYDYTEFTNKYNVKVRNIGNPYFALTNSDGKIKTPLWKKGVVFFLNRLLEFPDICLSNLVKKTIIKENNIDLLITIAGDETEKLKAMMQEIIDNSQGLPIVFPIHPRTAKIFKDLGITADNLKIVDPLGYLEFNYLVKHSFAVITDSGGITEETTVMGIPCLTLRDNTERPETITLGTNELVGTNPENIRPFMDMLFAGEWKKGGIPELWDGNASVRIIDKLIEIL